MSRSRRNSLTAISASLTGDDSPLIHCRSGCRKVRNATSPAARTVSTSAGASALRLRSTSGNGQPLDAHRRRVGAIAELEIVRRLERTEYCDQIARDRDFTHRIGAATILDPEPRCATAVVAGHRVHAHADQLGDVEAIGDVGDQLIGATRSRLDMQVGRSGRRRRGHAALSVPGGREIELARCGAVEEPGLEHAIVHDGLRARLDALAIEWTRALAALAQRIVNDADAGLEQALPKLVAQEAGLARDRSAVDGAGEMPDQAARDPAVEHDRNPLGGNLAGIEPGHCSRARRAPDLLRRIE